MTMINQNVTSLQRSTVVRPAPDASPDWLAIAQGLVPALASRAAIHDQDDSFVTENFAALKAAGLFKALVPVELGGHGGRFRDICQVVRVLASGCGSTALAFSMHCHLVAAAAWRWRHQQAPTDGLLRRVAAEDLVLISSGGSDWLDSGGRAEPVEGGYLIHARKVFSSGCLAGDLLMTSAVLDDPVAGPTVLHFAVPFKAAGLSIAETWEVMGMRGTGSHDVVLDGVFVAEAAVSGRRPAGRWHMLFHIISMIAFPLIYAAYVGVATGARQRALNMAQARGAGRPDTVQAAGEMENAYHRMMLAWQDMIDNAETAQPGPEATNRAMIGRTLVGDAAIETVTRALTLAGGGGFYRAAGLERAFRDVQGARFHPLQEKVQQRLAGRMALGLDIDD